MTRLETEVLAATMNLNPVEIQIAMGLLHSDENDLAPADRLAVARVLRQVCPLIGATPISAAVALIARVQRGTEAHTSATLKKLWAWIDAAGLRNEAERVLHWYAMLMRTAHALREVKCMDAGEPPSKTTLH